MNILIAGIPLPELVAHIQTRYKEDLKFFVCESRPFEVQVAQAVALMQASDVKVIVLTDNMMDALFRTHPIEAVWSLYTCLDKENVTAINGAHTAALLAKTHTVPFYMYPIHSLPEIHSGRLLSESVTVPGASYLDHALDTFSLQLVTGVVENE